MIPTFQVMKTSYFNHSEYIKKNPSFVTLSPVLQTYVLIKSLIPHFDFTLRCVCNESVFNLNTKPKNPVFAEAGIKPDWYILYEDLEKSPAPAQNLSLHRRGRGSGRIRIRYY